MPTSVKRRETQLRRLLAIEGNAHNFSLLSNQAASRGEIVPFVGAGLSKSCGMPTWREFLLGLARKTPDKSDPAAIRALLDEDDGYEKAAERLHGIMGSFAFQVHLEESFSHPIGTTPDRACAVRRLPHLSAGPVVTTNFDRVIEGVFEASGSSFEGVLLGARATSAVDAISKHRRVLLKIHGDVQEDLDRVLTAREYDEAYGDDGKNGVSMRSPLSSLLRQLASRPFLFLGCSLSSDRTLRVLQRCAAESDVRHFAVVSLPTTNQEVRRRRTFLLERHILPIWYPSERHDAVAVLLDEVLHRRLSVTVTQRTVSAAAAAADPGPRSSPPAPTGKGPSGILPDILTPTTPKLLHEASRAVGLEFDPVIIDLNRRAVESVEKGLFSEKLIVGAEMAKHFAHVPQFLAAGHYFKGEGFRLLADVERSDKRRQDLLKQSLEQYGMARDLYPGEVRAIRGMARTLEVMQDTERALQMFSDARSRILRQLDTGDPTPAAVAHEVLRSTRHYVNCLIVGKKSGPHGVLAERQKEEIRSYLSESERLHDEYMKRFAFQRGWALIEWFMALVFFGRAWDEIGSIDRKVLCLMRALKARRLAVPTDRPLTPDEQTNLRWNLRWWAGAALDGRNRPRDYDVLARAEDLVDALPTASDEDLLRMIDDVLQFYVIPLS